MNKCDNFVIIDGNSLVYRAFYAIPILTTTQGVYTNAAYGFTNMLFKILHTENPCRIAVVFDKGRITFRNEEYKDYKANRKAMPDELRPQFPIVKDILKAMGIPSYELKGYEGDDLIGTLSQMAEKENIDTLIVTGDRDALQLVSEKTKVILTKKGITELERHDTESVKERFGIYPDQFIDYRALTGDTSDNIPGVPGIGEKTAAKLIQAYGSLDELLNHVADLPKKQQEKLQTFHDQALLSRKLATIERNAPITVDFTQCLYTAPDYPQLIELFTRLEFKTLVKSIMAETNTNTAEISTTTLAVDYQKITKETNIEEILTNIQKKGSFSLALAGTKETGATLAAISTDEQTFLLSLTENDSPGLNLLKKLCADEKITTYCHDGKNIIWLLHYHQIALKSLGFDTMLASYLLNPATPNLDLADMLLQHLGKGLPSEEETLIAAQAKGIDALVPLLKEKLILQKEDSLFYEVELPLITVLAEMEITGVAVDKTILLQMSNNLGKRIDDIAVTIYTLAEEKFNINSPKQLGVILFEKLQLPVIKKTKTGYSTDASVLEQLEEKHLIVAQILQYRQLTKLKSTYADGLAALINQKTGCIHTTLHQMVTATGRLSSAEPNLQNIPIRLEEGRRIRQVFVPRQAENVIFTADYSQIELRVLAHISQDHNFLEAFNHGQDIHTRTASEVFGVPLDEVTKEMRSRAKAVNFGIVYGISDFGLARDIKVSRKEAKKYIDNYFARCPGVKKYIDQVVQTAKENGYVTTLLNRRRYLPELSSANKMTRSFGERAAMNTPIQGSAADIIKLAMIKVQEKLKETKLNAKMILQVHDELIFDVSKNELDQLMPLVKECMEQAIVLDVPLVVDMKIGPNWYETKPI